MVLLIETKTQRENESVFPGRTLQSLQKSKDCCRESEMFSCLALGQTFDRYDLGQVGVTSWSLSFSTCLIAVLGSLTKIILYKERIEHTSEYVLSAQGFSFP